MSLVVAQDGSNAWLDFRAPLVHSLQYLARLSYDDQNHLRADQFSALNFRPVTNTTLKVLGIDTPRAADFIADNGIRDVAFYVKAGTANILVGRTDILDGPAPALTEGRKFCAIRAPRTELSEAYRFEKHDHERFNHPAVVMPYASMPDRNGDPIEMLRFTPTLRVEGKAFDESGDPSDWVAQLRAACKDDAGKEKTAYFQRYRMEKGIMTVHVLPGDSEPLERLHQGFGLVLPKGGLSDAIGVLPYGSPVVTDPDTLKPGDALLRGELSNEYMRRLTVEGDLATKLLSPVFDDGTVKQTHFFPPDYLTRPFEEAPAVVRPSVSVAVPANRAQETQGAGRRRWRDIWPELTGRLGRVAGKTSPTPPTGDPRNPAYVAPSI